MLKKTIYIVLSVALLAFAALTWKSRNAANTENLRLKAELEELNQRIEDLAAAQQEPAPEVEQSEETAVVDSEEADEPAPPPPPVIPPPSLDLLSAASSAGDDGITATLTFAPLNDTPLGDLFVAVRLPGGEGRIEAIDFAPRDLLSFYQKRVSDSGDFAAARAQAGNLDRVELTVRISGPAELDVRGTCGIGPMSLVVTADGAVTGPPK